MERNLELAGNTGNSPADLIRSAVEGRADLDKLEKLLTLQEKWEANEARKAYHRAMAEFKANPPKIDKDMTVSFKTGAGTTSYNHASLANVTEKISEALSKCGLSASWQTKQSEIFITVTCKITHINGHSEETSLSAGADTSGSKNSIQAIGSTITYLERYTILALSGLATYDDDDGKASGAPVEYISEAQVEKILDLAVEAKADRALFLSYMKANSVEEILKNDFGKAINALQEKKKRAKE